MQIYRFVPDGRFRSFALTDLSVRWWPDGITLGRGSDGLFPRSLDGGPWRYEGNRFPGDPHGAPLSEFQLRAELKQARPLSVLMREQVQALREWARERTVPAD